MTDTTTTTPDATTTDPASVAAYAAIVAAVDAAIASATVDTTTVPASVTFDPDASAAVTAVMTDADRSARARGRAYRASVMTDAVSAMDMTRALAANALESAMTAARPASASADPFTAIVRHAAVTDAVYRAIADVANAAHDAYTAARIDGSHDGDPVGAYVMTDADRATVDRAVARATVASGTTDRNDIASVIVDALSTGDGWMTVADIRRAARAAGSTAGDGAIASRLFPRNGTACNVPNVTTDTVNGVRVARLDA